MVMFSLLMQTLVMLSQSLVINQKRICRMV
ncbi:hypothetical protein Ahy_B06g085101 isoform D [Arachis hypogaea]|uniref:Uncharacterized protein n=1 Tax=Arachis hypogaea TaxID=3818 RepID=A0A444YTH4_ARAHY|nr:hypothetical protein Ahy_B06g085101 isoform D [Arachis hypogaea]